MGRRLGKLHPCVTLLTYFALIVLSSAFLSPTLSPLALFCAIITAAITGRAKSILPLLKLIVPLMIVIVSINSFFGGEGVTVLFTLFERSVTLESVIYGVVSALGFSAAMLWAALMGEELSSDEIVYLFGRVSPYPALLMSMVLGLIPSMLSQLKEMREIEQGEKKKKKLFGLLTALVFASLEQALQTARSMVSRGFGTGRQTRVITCRFSSGDLLISLCLAAGIALALSGKLLGYRYSVYPIFSAPEADVPTVLFTCAFVFTMLLPSIHEATERLKWKFTLSKI